MTDLLTFLRRAPRRVTLLLATAASLAAPVQAQLQAAPRLNADYIVAVVNRELVTNTEVQQRALRAEQEAPRGSRLDPATLQADALDQLIDERAQLGYARDSGLRIEEAEIDRTISGIASQNELTLPALRERLREDGVDYLRFRSNIRDQMLLERVREREVQARLRISDADIENWLDDQRQKAGAASEYNVAQILVRLPENATPAQVAERRVRAVSALQRLRAGEDFAALVRELSDGNKEQGGELGMRRADRLPDVFVEAVRPLRAGEVAPQVIRSDAGLHVLKLVERKEATLSVVQNRARHILLRPGAGLTQAAALARLSDYRQQILSKRARFEELARQHSEDGSAPNGGDLGWAGPGQFVPEFEKVMLQLRPNEISEPLVSRFGVHLIQLLERRQVNLTVRQQREAARAALREQKYEATYADWAREIRARAYVELREPPGL